MTNTQMLFYLNNEKDKATTDNENSIIEIKTKKKKKTYNTEIGSGSYGEGASWNVEVNPSTDKPGAHEHDEHGAHREPNHCHHQIYPWRYHNSIWVFSTQRKIKFQKQKSTPLKSLSYPIWAFSATPRIQTQLKNTKMKINAPQSLSYSLHWTQQDCPLA